MNRGLKYIFAGLAGMSTVQAIWKISQGEKPWINIFFTLFFLALAFNKKKD